MRVLAFNRPFPKVPRPTRIKKNAIDFLYVSSAIIGFAVTYDAYFGSGHIKDEELKKELRIMQELNKNDKEMLEIVKRLDVKIAYNSKAISALEHHSIDSGTRGTCY